jgi:hypothetical protein
MALPKVCIVAALLFSTPASAIELKYLCTAVNRQNYKFTGLSRVHGVAAAAAVRRCEVAQGSTGCELESCEETDTPTQGDDDTVSFYESWSYHLGGESEHLDEAETTLM